MEEKLNVIEEEKVEAAAAPSSWSGYSVETLALLINTDRVKQLEAKTQKELEELRQRQGQVRFIHQLMRAINADADSNDALDWSKKPEFVEMLQKAREMGVEIPEGKVKFSAQEKRRLMDNLKLFNEDLNLQNEMQLQTVSRLNNERYESYQMARSILKPLHDDKIQKARHISGR